MILFILAQILFLSTTHAQTPDAVKTGNEFNDNYQARIVITPKTEAVLSHLDGWKEYLAKKPSDYAINKSKGAIQDLLSKNDITNADDVINCKFDVAHSPKGVQIPNFQKAMCQWGCRNETTNHFIAFDYEYIQNVFEKFKALGIDLVIELVTFNTDVGNNKQAISALPDFSSFVETINSVKSEGRYSANFNPDFKWLERVHIRHASNSEVNDDEYRYNYKLIFPGNEVFNPGDVVTIDPYSVTCILKSKKQIKSAAIAKTSEDLSSLSYWESIANYSTDFKGASNEDLAYGREFLENFGKKYVYPFSNNGFQFLGSTMTARFGKIFPQINFYEEAIKKFAATLKAGGPAAANWTVCDWTAPTPEVRAKLDPGMSPIDFLSALREKGELYFKVKLILNPALLEQRDFITSIVPGQESFIAKDVGMLLAREAAANQSILSTHLDSTYANASSLESFLNAEGLKAQSQAAAMEHFVHTTLLDKNVSLGEIVYNKIDIQVNNCRASPFAVKKPVKTEKPVVTETSEIK